MSQASHRLLDFDHFREHHVWRLKPQPGRPVRPLRCCHIRVYRHQHVPYQPRHLPVPVSFTLPPTTYEGKLNHALRTAEDTTLPPRPLTHSQTVTDVFRFSQTAFPLVLLEQLGPYWVIPSPVPQRLHIYLTRQQLEKIDPSHWTIHKSLVTTRHRWRKLLRRALNKACP